MKIAELMTAPVRTCTVNDSLNAAANVMWEHDCGIVPVLDAGGKLVGVVTDRDICMAAFFHGARLSELPVREVMARDLHTVRPEASLHDGLELMRAMQVRRVPVVDGEGALAGILSLADVARARGRGELRDDDVSEAFSAVTQSRRAADASLLVVEVQPLPRPEPQPAARRQGKAKRGKPAKGKPKARAKSRRN